MLYALVLSWLWLTVCPLPAHAVPLVTPVPGAVGDAGRNDASCLNLGNEGYNFTIRKGKLTMNLSIEENKAIVRLYIEEIWNQKNYAVSAEFIAPDCILNGHLLGVPPAPIAGRWSGIRSFLSNTRRLRR
jgi:hypothetical protein